MIYWDFYFLSYIICSTGLLVSIWNWMKQDRKFGTKILCKFLWLAHSIFLRIRIGNFMRRNFHNHPKIIMVKVKLWLYTPAMLMLYRVRRRPCKKKVGKIFTICCWRVKFLRKLRKFLLICTSEVIMSWMKRDCWNCWKRVHQRMSRCCSSTKALIILKNL